MSNRYKVPLEYTRQTQYEPGGLAREILLRQYRPQEVAESEKNMRVHWDDGKTLDPIDLIAENIDGPYLLVKKSLTSAARDKFRFKNGSDALEIELDPGADLLEINLATIPAELERLLLESHATQDSMKRKSTRRGDEEMVEEMGSALAAQHILTPRLYYPSHSIELMHERLPDDELDFDGDKVSALIDLLETAPPLKKHHVFMSLFELSSQTQFRTPHQPMFSFLLKKMLDEEKLKQKAITEKPVEKSD